MNGIDPFTVRFDRPLGAGQGPLAGLRLAVKDNFDVAGHVTGAGNPEWAATHPPAGSTAVVVEQMVQLGAVAVGKTHMDELAYSLMGQNARYGTPLNPAAPTRMPGGSSSGSAAAVAAGLADIGLGTDTGGSVRIPAAFCGLFGWRPTHGLLSAEGLVPLAQSYDVPGFITRDGATLARLAEQFAPDAAPLTSPPRAPADLWRALEETTAAALAPFRPAVTSPLFTSQMFDNLLMTFRTCQGAEVAAIFGDWITRHHPDFGPGIRERFDGAMTLAAEDIDAARAQRAILTAHLLDQLGNDGLLILPTATGPAPLLSCAGAAMEAYRNGTMTLLSLAGHAGLPQVSVPVAIADGAPVGLSLIGPRGSDRALISRACALMT